MYINDIANTSAAVLRSSDNVATKEFAEITLRFVLADVIRINFGHATRNKCELRGTYPVLCAHSIFLSKNKIFRIFGRHILDFGPIISSFS